MKCKKTTINNIVEYIMKLDFNCCKLPISCEKDNSENKLDCDDCIKGFINKDITRIICGE